MHYDSLKADEKERINTMDYASPNGESWRQVQQRAAEFLRDKTRDAKAGGLLVFTHGGLICSLTHDLGLTDIIPNGSIVALRLDRDGAPRSVEQYWEFPLEDVM